MRRLHSIRTDFTARSTKVELIARALASPPRRLADIVRLHDTLLFLRAFPDSPAVLAASRSASTSFHRIVRRARGSLWRAEDTGLIGTVTRNAFAFPVAAWLHRWFPDEVEIDWSALDDPSVVDALLRPLVRRAEEDAFDSGELSTREWIGLRRGPSKVSDLGVVLSATPRGARARAAFAARFDEADIQLRWTLGEGGGATIHNVLRWTPIHYRRSMRRAPDDPVRFVATPLRDIERLSRRRANAVIHVARAALAARGREVHAMAYSNPDEIYLADLGEGTSVAVIGVLPEARMSLESNYGYLMMSNGVPVGYGGVTPLYRQGNTGLNIFPSFRGGEAAYLWIATLRAFHSLFGICRFVVNGYQVGDGNTEAIRSGAFWFYYRLGFRPSDAARRALARREYARLRGGRKRTSPSVLRRLAAGDVWLDLPGFRQSDFFDEALLVECGRRVTALYAAEDGVGPADAPAAVVDRVTRVLGARGRNGWAASERRAFEDLAPVCALLPGLTRLGSGSRAALVRLMRAKGATQEREFVDLARRDPQFFPRLLRALR